MTQPARSTATRRYSLHVPAEDKSDATSASDAITAFAEGTPDTPSDDAFEVLSPRSPEGFGFNFKVRATGAQFRCEPMRHPQQPRFWCLSIYHCVAVGSPNEAQPRWISDAYITREELPTAMPAIRANFAAWLADPTRRELYAWLLAQAGRTPLRQELKLAEEATVS